MLFRNLDHCLHTLRSHEHLIKPEEGVLKSLPKVFFRLELRLLSQFRLEKLFTEFGTLETSMPIKNGKEANPLLVEVRITDMRVFHIKSPSLHGRTGKFVSNDLLITSH